MAEYPKFAENYKRLKLNEPIGNAPSTSGINTKKSDKWAEIIRLGNSEATRSPGQKKVTPVRSAESKLAEIKQIGLEQVSIRLSNENKELNIKNNELQSKLDKEKDEVIKLDQFLEKVVEENKRLKQQLIQKTIDMDELKASYQSSSSKYIQLARKAKERAGELGRAAHAVLQEVQEANKQRGYATFGKERVSTVDLDDLYKLYGSRPQFFFTRLCKLVKGGEYCMTHQLTGRKDSVDKFDPQTLKDIMNYCKDVLEKPFKTRQLSKSYSHFKANGLFVTEERIDFDLSDDNLTVLASDSDECYEI